MKHGKHRVRDEHARAGVPHNPPELREPGGIEALGRAKTAYRLGLLPKRARLDAFHRVTKHLLAPFTNGESGMAMTATVDLYHVPDRLLFSIQTSLAV